MLFLRILSFGIISNRIGFFFSLSNQIHHTSFQRLCLSLVLFRIIGSFLSISKIFVRNEFIPMFPRLTPETNDENYQLDLNWSPSLSSSTLRTVILDQSKTDQLISYLNLTSFLLVGQVDPWLIRSLMAWWIHIFMRNRHFPSSCLVKRSKRCFRQWKWPSSQLNIIILFVSVSFIVDLIATPFECAIG